MATPYSGPQHTFTMVASDDLSARQYHAVRLVAENVIGLATAGNTSTLLGILQNKPKLAEHATVADQGISKWTAGGSVAAGAFLTANSVGRATAAVSGDWILGRALTAVGASGEVLSAELDTPTRLFA